jgi:DNA adenine methylase
MNRKSVSPLRYPGGKTKMYPIVKALIEHNKCANRIYVEPFSGGFGVGLKLLSEDVVKEAVLNDYDTHIYNFWYSLFNNTEEFIDMIRTINITVDERERQKLIYNNYCSSRLNDGFATFFLNRVNFSGVISGGVLGGNLQSGKTKIDCRFNKHNLIEIIRSISALRHRIRLYDNDACELMFALSAEKNEFFFNIDPPYVSKGKYLYQKYFDENDHIKLRDFMVDHMCDHPWIITYDRCYFIKRLYGHFHQQEFSLKYSVNNTGVGNELLISNNMNIKEGFVS